jgi:hypothetical protein
MCVVIFSALYPDTVLDTGLPCEIYLAYPNGTFVLSCVLSQVINDTPIFHDESNISWDPPDVRMTNVVGAIYDALFISGALTNGGTSVARWNEADGWCVTRSALRYRQ